METDQELLGEDKELSELYFLRDIDPMLPILPSPEIPKVKLENGPPARPPTPMHSPHPFLQDEMLFSPPFIPNLKKEDSLPSCRFQPPRSPKILRKRKTNSNSVGGTPPKKKSELNLAETPPEKPAPSSVLFIKPIALPVGSEKSVWQPTPLLRIISQPTPDLVRRLAAARVAYICPTDCEIPRK